MMVEDGRTGGREDGGLLLQCVALFQVTLPEILLIVGDLDHERAVECVLRKPAVSDVVPVPVPGAETTMRRRTRMRVRVEGEKWCGGYLEPLCEHKGDEVTHVERV